MSLPSGYTQLEYIESHGTEYFDTGFVPDGDSHVVVDFEVATGSFGTLFGARVTSSTNAFAIWVDTTVNDSYQAFPQYGNVVFNTKPIAINVGQKLTYELNKGVATVGGTTQTFTNQTFSAGCNLALFAINTNGVVDDRRTTGKLYSAKVYDNGTLIRDYIPCLNASGTVGLWDDVNGVFYSNAGSGTFDYHISKKHKTRIDSTGYETKSGRVLIDGTGYSIKKGRTLIDGTGYDISFDTPVGELDVGTSVYMDVDGTRREFIVVHQGNPDSSLYDASCDGTWVWQKYVYETHGWEAKYDATNQSKTGFAYTQSGVHDWLNADYLDKFDSNITALIKTVKIPYQYNTYVANNGKYIWHYPNGSNGLETKAFLPSLMEMGIKKMQYRTTPEQVGVRLDYFKEYAEYPYDGDADFAAHEPGGSATTFFSRQILEENDIHTGYFGTDGSYQGMAISYYGTIATAGILPFLILPSEEAKIDDEFNIIAP